MCFHISVVRWEHMRPDLSLVESKTLGPTEIMTTIYPTFAQIFKQVIFFDLLVYKSIFFKFWICSLKNLSHPADQRCCFIYKISLMKRRDFQIVFFLVLPTTDLESLNVINSRLQIIYLHSSFSVSVWLYSMQPQLFWETYSCFFFYFFFFSLLISYELIRKNKYSWTSEFALLFWASNVSSF